MFVMIELFEPETFKLPDGTVYEIIPLATEDVDLLLDFIDTQSKRKTPKGKKEDTKLNVEFTLKELTPIADKIVDKGTIQQNGTDPLPMKYRNIKNRIELCMEIIKITMGNPEEGEPDPKLQEPAPKSKE